MLPEFNVWYNLYCLDSPAGIVEFPPQPAAVTPPPPAIVTIPDVNQPSTSGATSATISGRTHYQRNAAPVAIGGLVVDLGLQREILDSIRTANAPDNSPTRHATGTVNDFAANIKYEVVMRRNLGQAANTHSPFRFQLHPGKNAIPL